MSITYPIAMPAMPPGPAQLTLMRNYIVAAGDSPFTAQRQIYDYQAGFWAAKVDLPYLTRAQAAPWIAFLAMLNGKSGSFLFGDPTVTGPLGTPGTPAAQGGQQGSGQLIIAGLSGALAAGDYFQLGTENRLLWSQAFDNAAWSYQQVTRPGGPTIVAPDGSTTAEALVPTGSPTDCYVTQSCNLLVCGQTYTFSVWLKVPSGTKTIRIMFRDSVGADVFTSCSLTTSWQRFSVTRTMSVTGTSSVFIGSGSSWTAGEVDAWNAQVELGASAQPLGTTLTTTVPLYNRRLYQNMTPAPAGSTLLDIFPRVRDNIQTFTPQLVFANPLGMFRLDSNADQYVIDNAGHYSISFTAREAV